VASPEELDLRRVLAELVPAGGTPDDTHFSDADIAALLADADGVLPAAAAQGWQIKAGIYADLVNVSDAGQSRALGELHAHAVQMVALYQRQTPMRTWQLTRTAST
jgi:hypothetical protein